MSRPVVLYPFPIRRSGIGKVGGQARYAASLADITAGHENRVKLVMGEANRYCAARRSRSFAAITPATQQE